LQDSLKKTVTLITPDWAHFVQVKTLATERLLRPAKKHIGTAPVYQGWLSGRLSISVLANYAEIELPKKKEGRH